MKKNLKTEPEQVVTSSQKGRFTFYFCTFCLVAVLVMAYSMVRMQQKYEAYEGTHEALQVIYEGREQQLIDLVEIIRETDNNAEHADEVQEIVNRIWY